MIVTMPAYIRYSFMSGRTEEVSCSLLFTTEKAQADDLNQVQTVRLRSDTDHLEEPSR